MNEDEILNILVDWFGLIAGDIILFLDRGHPATGRLRDRQEGCPNVERHRGKTMKQYLIAAVRRLFEKGKWWTLSYTFWTLSYRIGWNIMIGLYFDGAIVVTYRVLI